MVDSSYNNPLNQQPLPEGKGCATGIEELKVGNFLKISNAPPQYNTPEDMNAYWGEVRSDYCLFAIVVGCFCRGSRWWCTAFVCSKPLSVSSLRCLLCVPCMLCVPCVPMCFVVLLSTVPPPHSLHHHPPPPPSTTLHHQFGGQFIPETLVHAHDELAKQYVTLTKDPEFQAEFEKLGRDFIGRPTAMYHAERLSNKLGGAQIWIKREDLAHTGAHKINNAIGQVLLAKKLGKNRIIAETGAGQVRTNSKTVYHRRNSTEAAPHTGARTITD